LQAARAAAGDPANPLLTPDARGRLSEAARDQRLAPWQREFMLDVARGRAVSSAAGGLPAPQGAAQWPAGAAAQDGAWIAIPPPAARYGHTAIYDPVRDRMLVFGGSDLNDVWALSLAGSPAWRLLAPSGTPPSAREAPTAIYDPVRDRMLVFGGNYGSYLNDVWALSLGGSPAWSALAPDGTPPCGRELHTAIYDPLRDRMLVFGGVGDLGLLNDVWALSLAGSPAWSALVPDGISPSARSGHTATYDPVRDRMLVFGGYDGTVNLGDLWALSLAGNSAWSALVPAGISPSVRSGHRAIYDPVRDRMLVLGGNDGTVNLGDVWALSLGVSPTWSALAPTGTPPSARYEPTAIYDPIRDRLVLFGGADSSDMLNDVWALSLVSGTAWSALVPAGPPTRQGHTAIYDPVRDRMLVCGGNNFFTNLDDVWALSLAGSPTWSLLAPAGPHPPTLRLHTAIYDPVRDRMLVFGGTPDNVNVYGDVWALSLAGGMAWSALTPTGTPPSARFLHTAIYDPVRDRMLVFGGYDGTVYFSDVWALSLAGSPAWTALVPAGIPPSARYGHTSIYDPVRDRMLVFGGYDGAAYLNDVWALSLAVGPEWSALAPTGTGPARSAHSAIYDPVRDRMVVYAGGNGFIQDDVWALSLTGSPVWTALAPAGSRPSGRYLHTAIYDPVRDRMLAFGGVGFSYLDDTWALEWGATVSVPRGNAVPSRFELAAPRPNPSSGPVTLDFTVPQAAHVSIAIYDAAGRMVRRLEDGPLPVGRRSTSWDGRDSGGRAVPAGIYLVRLSAPGARLVRKSVIVHAGSLE
jgi:hypothetical protein